MSNCSKCGAPVENGKCTYCGAVYQAEPAQQSYAPNPYAAPAGQSPTVVNIINQAPSYEPPTYYVSAKSKGVALVLAIFLGYLGAHYFYAGKAGMGILYFFTLGLFCIGWIVDIFRIASGSFRDASGYPIQ